MSLRSTKQDSYAAKLDQILDYRKKFYALRIRDNSDYLKGDDLKKFNAKLRKPTKKLPQFIKLMKKQNVEFILDEIRTRKRVDKPTFLVLFEKCFKENFEKVRFLIRKLYEKIDVNDSGYITFGEFIDFVFEQGLSKAVKQKEIIFTNKREIKINPLHVFYLVEMEMFAIQEKHTFSLHLFRERDLKKVFEFDFPEKHHHDITGIHYFKKQKELFIIFNNRTVVSLFTTKKTLKRYVEFPEVFVDFCYAESLKSIFCVGLCGKIYNLNSKFYFSLQFEHLTRARLENWRMLCKPMRSYEEAPFYKATCITWIKAHELLVFGSRDTNIYIYCIGAGGFKLKIKLSGHLRPVKHLHYSRKFKYIFSAGNDCAIFIWNPFVRKHLMKLKIDAEIGGVIKSLSYPQMSPILSCLTDNNKLIFWDLGTYSKIQVRHLQSNAKYDLRQNLPFLIKNDGILKIEEFKEMNVIEKIEFKACFVSWPMRMMFLGMKGAKLGSIDLESFNILNQRLFLEMEEIVDIQPSKNHKKLYVAGETGLLSVINVFTFEEYYRIKDDNERYIKVDFMLGHSILVQTFQQSVAYKTIDFKTRTDKTLSKIHFKSLGIKLTCIFEENVAIAFTSGEILIMKIFANKIITHFFTASEKAITFIEFLFKGNWLIYGDSDGNCILIYLENFQLMKYTKKRKSEVEGSGLYSTNNGHDEGEIKVFKVYWDDPENVKENTDENNTTKNDFSVMINATGVMQDPSSYGDRNILYIFDSESRIHSLEISEMVEDIVTGYEVEDIDKQDSKSFSMNSTFRKTNMKKKSGWKQKNPNSRQILPSFESRDNLELYDEMQKNNCLSYLRTHTMEYGKENILQFTNHKLSRMIFDPHRIKTTRVASMFNYNIKHSFSLDKEKFAVVDEKNELFIFKYSSIVWDDHYKQDKKVSEPEAKINLNKMQDQFNNNIIQNEAANEKILIPKQLDVVKYYTKRDLTNIATDMKRLVQDIDQLKMRSSSVSKSRDKGFRIMNGSRSVKRRRKKHF